MRACFNSINSVFNVFDKKRCVPSLFIFQHCSQQLKIRVNGRIQRFVSTVALIGITSSCRIRHHQLPKYWNTFHIVVDGVVIRILLLNLLLTCFHHEPLFVRKKNRARKIKSPVGGRKRNFSQPPAAGTIHGI